MMGYAGFKVWSAKFAKKKILLEKLDEEAPLMADTSQGNFWTLNAILMSFEM